ncbi:Csu type fimbrial protein [Luteimonas aquatica]|uniref:Csu type fimbrial protein n=1 Tax=Luteimonas aquatica TaxID=450364 RepID=UPI001F5AC040|nr:spore coat U domain-containing protein [Luteimonas aquatica]
MRLSKSALLATALLAVGGQAAAADTTQFNVKIIILKACTITAAAATDVDFGSVAGDSTANADAQGSVTAKCSPLTPYNIALNAGLNPSTANDVNTRRMKNIDGAVTTNNFVAYQLYQNSQRTTVWGSTVGTNTLSATGTGLNQVYPVFGRVANPSTNNAAAGSYLDTITATIVY